jgi:hypothetical protein
LVSGNSIKISWLSFQFWLKFYNNNGHFTWRSTRLFVHILSLLIIYQREKCFKQMYIFKCTSDQRIILSRIRRLYKMGYWIDNWIYWITNRLHTTHAVLLAVCMSHSIVAWLPSNGCQHMPYCLQRPRHNIKVKENLTLPLASDQFC